MNFMVRVSRDGMITLPVNIPEGTYTLVPILVDAEGAKAEPPLENITWEAFCLENGVPQKTFNRFARAGFVYLSDFDGKTRKQLGNVRLVGPCILDSLIPILQKAGVQIY